MAVQALQFLDDSLVNEALQTARSSNDSTLCLSNGILSWQQTRAVLALKHYPDDVIYQLLSNARTFCK